MKFVESKESKYWETLSISTMVLTAITIIVSLFIFKDEITNGDASVRDITIAFFIAITFIALSIFFEMMSVKKSTLNKYYKDNVANIFERLKQCETDESFIELNSYILDFRKDLPFNGSKVCIESIKMLEYYSAYILVRGELRKAKSN